MQQTKYIVLTALLLASGCANQASSQQASDIKWEELNMAQTMVKPSNSFLIMMR